MNKYYFVLFFVALIMLALPFSFREDSVMPGNQLYYHSVAGSDVSFFQGGRYVWEPLHIFKFLDQDSPSLFDSLLKYSGFLFSFLSFVLLFFILKRVFPEQSFWILLVFSLSPTLMASSFIGPRESFALFFILLGWLFFEHSLFVPGCFSFLVPALSGLPALIAVSALVFLLSFTHNKKVSYFMLSIFTLILFLLPRPPQFIEPSLFAVFSDLGGLFGVGIFLCVLLLIGIFVVWQLKSKRYIVFAVCTLLIGLCFIFPEMLVFVNVFLCIIAGFAMHWLFSRKWVFPFLRRVSILTILCGMLFSAVVHAHVLADIPPDDSLFEVANISPGVFLTHEGYGFWLQYLGHSVIVDPLTYKQPDGRSRLRNLHSVFNTNVLRDVVDYSNHYHITHILISKDMVEGLVWSRENMGLHNLVNNRETFKMVSDDGNYTLWELR